MREWVVIGISDDGENLFWFWFVADEVNKERVTRWVLNKVLFRTDVQGQTLEISNRIGSLIIQMHTSYLKYTIFDIK